MQAELLMVLTCAGYVAPYAWDRIRLEWENRTPSVQIDTARLQALLAEWDGRDGEALAERANTLGVRIVRFQDRAEKHHSDLHTALARVRAETAKRHVQAIQQSVNNAIANSGGRMMILPHDSPEVIGAVSAASAWCAPAENSYSLPERKSCSSCKWAMKRYRCTGKCV